MVRRVLQDSPHRTLLPTGTSLRALGCFDEAVTKCLIESTGIERTDRARRQARLGITSGGLGLRSPEKHALAAHIASVTISSIASIGSITRWGQGTTSTR